MGPLLFRIALIAVGFGTIEIGLTGAFAGGSPLEWALVLVVGLPLLLAGSAGFMRPLFENGRTKGDSHDA